MTGTPLAVGVGSRSAVDADAVVAAVRAALAGAGPGSRLLVPRRTGIGVTVAVAAGEEP
jgi:cobalamin biosynthesis protein CbiG